MSECETALRILYANASSIELKLTVTTGKGVEMRTEPDSESLHAKLSVDIREITECI